MAPWRTLFAVTFLYAIAFVGGFAVPTQLDGPATSPFSTALAVDALLLAVFAVQHSVMARRWFKNWWTQVVPRSSDRRTCSSRALPSICCSGSGALLAAPCGALSNRSCGRSSGRFSYGWLQVLVVTGLINHFDLFGLRQVWLHLIGRQHAGRLRHPGAISFRPSPRNLDSFWHSGRRPR